MKKTTRILLVLIILALISCSDNSRKSETKNDKPELISEPNKDLGEKHELQQKDSLAKEIDCSQFSLAMRELKKLLESDNYKVEFKGQQKDLCFRIKKPNGKFEADKTVSFPKPQVLTIYAKRKNKLERMQNNWYPSFSVTEICFQDEKVASKTHKEISEIINSGDIFNEKVYDYILKNGNRLIYVSCGAKIFEEYAFSYKNKIEELITNSRR